MKEKSRARSHPETFKVTAYANTTIIGTFENITLTSGNTKTITFSWNTTDAIKGNYTMNVIATLVPGETDTENNMLYADECVCVTIPGDVDCDRDVDLYDAVKLLVVYGAKKGQPKVRPQPRHKLRRKNRSVRRSYTADTLWTKRSITIPSLIIL